MLFRYEAIHISTNLQSKQNQSTSMFTIKVLLSTLPGGYAPILAAYNARRPAESEPIRAAGVCEGGFEIPLNAEEIKQKEKYAKERDRMLDANSYVRQLRWRRGELTSGYYAGFTIEETKILYEALIEVLGSDKVTMTDY